MTCQSPMKALAATTRIRTSPRPATGVSTSSNRRTSAEPYSSWTIAFMAALSDAHVALRDHSRRFLQDRRRPEPLHDEVDTQRQLPEGLRDGHDTLDGAARLDGVVDHQDPRYAEQRAADEAEH